MLVLSRKYNESVVVGGTNGLGDGVRVTVLEIDRGQVKLGFEAKTDVSVHREEVWKQILAERLAEASATLPAGLDQWADDGGPEPQKDRNVIPCTARHGYDVVASMPGNLRRWP